MMYSYIHIYKTVNQTFSNITTRKWIIYMYEYTYVCMYVCMYTYIRMYIHTRRISVCLLLGYFKVCLFLFSYFLDTSGPAAQCQALAVFFIYFLFLFL